jgi:hypothetical protein
MLRKDKGYHVDCGARRINPEDPRAVDCLSLRAHGFARHGGC